MGKIEGTCVNTEYCQVYRRLTETELLTWDSINNVFSKNQTECWTSSLGQSVSVFGRVCQQFLAT